MSTAFAHRKYFAVVLAAALLVMISLIYAFDPVQARWMPKCIFHAITGYDCPSCGSTRALHDILHGRFADGLRHNAFILISWPVLAIVAYYAIAKPRWMKTKWILRLVYAYLCLYVIWWVLRNIYQW